MTNEEIILLGKVSGQVETILSNQEAQSKSIGKLFDGLNDVNKALLAFPCSTHEGKLKLLGDWKDACSKDDANIKLETVKGGITLKNALIILAITNGFTLVISLLTTYLTRGGQ